MARPRQHVHAQGRRVRELQEEHLVARDLLDRRGVVPAGQDVEAVEADADRVVVRELDDAPGSAVVVDVPPPRQRLEGDPYAVLRRDLPEAVQLLGRQLVVVDRRGADVAAHEHRVDAQPLHEEELGPGPPQHTSELVLADTLGVPERLVEVQGEPQPGRQRHDLLRAARGGDQVGLEDLHPVEAGAGRCVQLVGQGAAEADRRDRGAHHSSSGVEGVSSRAGLSTIIWWTCSSVAPPSSRRGRILREMFSRFQCGTCAARHDGGVTRLK